MALDVAVPTAAEDWVGAALAAGWAVAAGATVAAGAEVAAGALVSWGPDVGVTIIVCGVPSTICVCTSGRAVIDAAGAPVGANPVAAGAQAARNSTKAAPAATSGQWWLFTPTAPRMPLIVAG